jgi:hypothetical protein
MNNPDRTIYIITSDSKNKTRFEKLLCEEEDLPECISIFDGQCYRSPAHIRNQCDNLTTFTPSCVVFLNCRERVRKDFVRIFSGKFGDLSVKEVITPDELIKFLPDYLTVTLTEILQKSKLVESETISKENKIASRSKWLFIIVTRSIDTMKGSGDDEFIQEWKCNEKDDFHWVLNGDAIKILLIHGHEGVSENFKDTISNALCEFKDLNDWGAILWVHDNIGTRYLELYSLLKNIYPDALFPINLSDGKKHLPTQAQMMNYISE